MCSYLDPLPHSPLYLPLSLFRPFHTDIATIATTKFLLYHAFVYPHWTAVSHHCVISEHLKYLSFTWVISPSLPARGELLIIDLFIVVTQSSSAFQKTYRAYRKLAFLPKYVPKFMLGHRNCQFTEDKIQRLFIFAFASFRMFSYFIFWATVCVWKVLK